MALSKQDRDQIVSLQATQTVALLSLLDQLTPPSVSDDPPPQGANPPAVQEFIDRIMVPSGRQRTPEEQAATEAAANAPGKPGAGSIAASSLTDADAVYLLEAQDTALRQLGPKWKDVYNALLSGSAAEIAKVRDIRSRKSAQGTLSEYNADKGAWVAKYAPGSKLEQAFHKWLRAEKAK